MIVRLNLNNSTARPIEKRQRIFRWTERVLWLSGLAALGFYAYVHADTWIYQDYQGWVLDRNIAGKDATAYGYLEHVIEDKLEQQSLESADAVNPRDATNAARSPEESPVASLTRPTDSGSSISPKKQDRSLVGRIEIPRVRVSAVVREGVDDRTLRHAVGHVPGTALPGKPGNIALAGHRDTFFTGLRNIRKSDRIQVRTLDGEFEYEVDAIRIVTPKDVEVLAPTKEPALTLVTCYPFNYVGSAPKRYIVRAKQVRPNPGDVVEAKNEGSVLPGAASIPASISGSAAERTIRARKVLRSRS